MISLDKLNISLSLTIARLVLSFSLIPFLIFYFLPHNMWWMNALVAFVFSLICITDFLDGYLARLNKEETSLGKILDPIADKFLVYSTLVSLLAVGKIYFYWVILLIGRELFVTGLRLIALENKFKINVSYLGKIKTIFQMIMLTFLILNPYQNVSVDKALVWHKVEWILLSSTIILSLLSAALYCHSFVKEWKRRKRELNNPATK